MIDIIVPTYNRPDDVKRFVFEIQKQVFVEYRVYIIDDFGSAPLHELLPKNDPRFELIRLEKNIGQAGARNVGLSLGNADIVVSLDDDAWFEYEDGLSRLFEYFDKYPDAGCIMFNVITPERPYLSEFNGIAQEGQIIGGHITCGCAYRRSVIEEVKGFGSFLHSGAEEVDLTLKIIQAGYSVRFSKQIKVFHNYIPSVRTDQWYFKTRYNTCRNDILVVWMRYPFIFILPYTFGKLFGHLRYVATQKRRPILTSGYIVASFFGALSMFSLAIKNRKPLSLAQFKKWSRIRW